MLRRSTVASWFCEFKELMKRDLLHFGVSGKITQLADLSIVDVK
jgi:hypothetical protein